MARGVRCDRALRTESKIPDYQCCSLPGPTKAGRADEGGKDSSGWRCCTFVQHNVSTAAHQSVTGVDGSHKGGLGLTTGIADVGSLGEASTGILEMYYEVRRLIFSDVVDVPSAANFERIMQDVDQVICKDTFFSLLEAAKSDQDVAGQLLQVS